jgi:hypothetical protein
MSRAMKKPRENTKERRMVMVMRVAILVKKVI